MDVARSTRDEAALEAELAEHVRQFAARFPEAGPPRLYLSPGRVNLMGAHLDYNGGPVMPTAIDRGTFVALAPRADRTVRLASTIEGEARTFDLDDLPRRAAGEWCDYAVGVLRELGDLATERGTEQAICGMDVLFGGNLPIGAGLSSSASICVGAAVAIDALWGTESPLLELVDAALRAERGFVGVQCGIMDPYAVGLSRGGSLLWLDCKDASWRHLPLAEDVAIVVADTLVRRQLAQGEFNRRVKECAAAFARLRQHCPAAECLRDVPRAVLEEHGSELEEPLRRRARHVIEEVERTFAAREALLAGRVDAFGALMTSAHASLRELFEVSCPELDRLVEDAVAVPGVLGGRLTGAGFGGCAVILARASAVGELEVALQRGFRAAFGATPLVRRYASARGPREIDY